MSDAMPATRREPPAGADDAAIRRAIDAVAERFGGSVGDFLRMEYAHKHALELSLLTARLPRSGARMLDVGGGLGVNLMCLRRLLGEDAELTLVDRFREYTTDNRMGPEQHGRRLMEEHGVVAIDQDFWQNPALPFEDAHFDVVSLLDVIEHLPGHPLALLREIRRVLRPGGTLLLSGPNAVSLLKRIYMAIGRHPYMNFEAWTGDAYFAHFREYTPDEYRALASRAGFRVETRIREFSMWRDRAGNRWYKGRRLSVLDPTMLAIYGMWLVQLAVPALREDVYCVAVRDRD